MYQLGIDVGGTFTDLVLYDEEKKSLIRRKVLSTYPDPSRGVKNALVKSQVAFAEVSRFVHATTFAINTILQRKGVTTGLITTKGFRDVLELMREAKADIYDFQWDKPVHLVPRHLRLEASERVNFRGEVLKPLDPEDVRKAVAYFKEKGVKAVAICFLYSFMNPSHEQQAKEIVKREYPEACVSVSHEILPEIREYERTSTTVVDAYLKPLMDEYLTRLEEGCRQEGYQSDISMFKSDGGIYSIEQAKEVPIYTVSGGPAGGVIAVNMIAKILNRRNLITLDMGGTSCDLSLIHNGTPRYTTEWEIEWGIPVKMPFLDVHSIGAGGGTIAWFDKAGALRVGPNSAGANPGPACYGQGGKEPTVTDANLVLNRLDPNYFLDGEMKLFPELAEESIVGRLGGFLKRSSKEIAQGIIDVVNANMVQAIRLISVERGLDPREFSLVAFGGAGAMHASWLARELNMPEVIVPAQAGTLSAFGQIAADVRIDALRSYPVRMNEISMSDVETMLWDMEKRGREQLSKEGFKGQVVIERAADMRYIGQNFEVTVSLPNKKLTEDERQNITERFKEGHRRMWGFATDEPQQLLTLRVNTIGVMPELELPRLDNHGRSVAKAKVGQKSVYFSGETRKCHIYYANYLPADCTIIAPAIIEKGDATVVVPSGDSIRVDGYGNLLIKIGN